MPAISAHNSASIAALTLLDADWYRSAIAFVTALR
jgi:hypothetical protein